MSALGQKQTFASASTDVRFTLESGDVQAKGHVWADQTNTAVRGRIIRGLWFLSEFMDQVRDTPIKAERGSGIGRAVLCGLQILSGGLLLQGFRQVIGALA